MSTHRHFIIYKPFGYLSQFIDNSSIKEKLLGQLYDFPEAIMAVGRLDEKSEGLLLLTTDGKLSDHIRGRGIEKEYYAQVDGIATPEALAQMTEGVEIGLDGQKYQTLPCRAFKLDTTPELPDRGRKIRDERHGPTCWVSVTVTEGKYRQVRKMTAAAGLPTLRLVRVRIGNTWLGDMQPGEVREVEQFDL
jgi:23S rRNA pseudouridine2457 synthase